VGIIDPNKHDAFFSYAHLDSEARANLVPKFCTALKTKIKHEITGDRPDLGNKDVDLFLDTKDLEKTGEVDGRLTKHIRDAWFLCVFMSKHYRNSPWCDKELDWFKENFRGEESAALKHTIIIVLEKEALTSGWKSYLSGEQKPLYYEFFDKTSEKTYQFDAKRASDGRTVIDPDVDDILNNIASQVAKMALGELIPAKKITTVASSPTPIAAPSVVTRPAPGMSDSNQKSLQKLPSTPEKLRIAIGLVTPDLMEVRKCLQGALEAEENIEVQALDIKDFKKLEDIQKRVDGAKLFVQPYSYHPVEFDYFDKPDGGHLKYQELLIKEIQKSVEQENEAKPIPIWWWYPEGEAAVVKLGAEQQLAKENRHFSYIESLRERAKTECSEDMVEEIRKILGLRLDSPSMYQLPTVMIESSPEDEERSERIAQTIAGLWTQCDEFKECGPLLTYPLEWNMLDEFTGYLRDCDGFVFVYGSKQYGSLFHQVQRLDSNLKLIGWEPGRAVIAVPPEKKAYERKNFWNTVRFYENGKLHEEDERAALRFLSRVKEAWESKNGAQASAA